VRHFCVIARPFEFDDLRLVAYRPATHRKVMPLALTAPQRVFIYIRSYVGNARSVVAIQRALFRSALKSVRAESG
jgi:hypothetical protein